MLPVDPSIVAHNLVLEEELRTACSTLRSAGIPVVVQKGFPLLRRLGLPLHDRRMLDNDILVRRRDVAAAAQVLRELGYRDRTQRSLAASLDLAYQHSLVRVARGHQRVVLALHWQSFAPWLYDVAPELEWRHVERVSLGEQEFDVFDRPLTLLHTACHFIQHGFGELRILRTLGAAWSQWRADSGEDTFALARETGTLPTLEYSLLAASTHGFTEYAREPRSVRARALLKLLPPARLLEPRPARDDEWDLLSVVLVSPGRAGKRLLGKVVPPPAKVTETVGSDDLWRMARYYALRPASIVRGWLKQREELARLRTQRK